MRIMGIDIEPRSSPSSSIQPKYSAVIIDENGNIIEKFDEISIPRIIRLTWEYNISIIATDNIYELGKTDREIIKLVSLMPDNIEIVQVTYNNGDFLDIREVAKKLGIDVQGKPGPGKTAYLAAILALKGAGSKIKLIENKTKIIISRGRHTGPGGMSSNRYKRHLRGLVLRVFKQVKEALDKNNFDYDVIVKRSKAGMENATFIVYAPRESLYGIVKKMRGHDVNLEIRPVYKTKIDFESHKTVEKKPLIVGIDPGLDIGISILNVYGAPELLVTKRGIDRDEVISIISEKGIPVIIATDVNPVPDAVRKIASQLRTKIFVPEKSLSVDEKQLLVNEFSNRFQINITDPHIRDSLAAAIKAYKELEKKLRQATSIMHKFDLDLEENNIYKCVMEGNTISECIEKEIERKIDKQDITISNIQQNTSEITQKNYQKIYDENLQLKREIYRLKRDLAQLINEKYLLEKRIEELKTQTKIEVEKDRTIYKLKSDLTERNKIISNLQNIISEYQNRILYLESIINDLVSKKIKIIKSNDIINIEKHKVRILGQEINENIFRYVGDNFILDNSEDIIRDSSILEKEIQKELTINDIKNIVEEYRKSKHRDFSV
ncbi:DUF460 domain-containing protein [Acidianus sulfidivorans JP7]|uniref:DUF460 domain-containing protein n=1 Tax=Acidianus sulfidivorans JP7 TaxID=619593 RepID=A0A2U9IMU5_9CREN|nr:DUF460 domain-containing protein [Acidianus sulfidivorans]AWR97327.1 DUF460 domain-containing protein [Acidianus sulfidivorans JP7]